MKVFYHILIIIFVLISLFVIKDDVISVYQKSKIYIKNNIHTVLDLPKKIFFNENDTVDDSVMSYEINKTGDDNADAKSTSPGPLRVLNQFVASNSEVVKLSPEKIIEMTNVNRKNNGNLPSLVMDLKLNLSAEKKLKDMFDNQYFEHISPVGVGVSELGSEVGYEYILIGENLALGNFKDENALLSAWMASPGHKANILNTHYVEMGVAVGKGRFEGRNVWMAIQHFALPKSICPSIDGALHGLIVMDQEYIDDVEADLSTRKTKIDSGAVSDGKTKNEQIIEYNSIVTNYNELLLNLKNKINKYNKQVEVFNLCIENALK